MTKYHINDNGDPGKCSVTTGKCPYGNASEHYHSKADARTAYETTMRDRLPQDWEAIKNAKKRLKETEHEVALADDEQWEAHKKVNPIFTEDKIINLLSTKAKKAKNLATLADADLKFSEAKANLKAAAKRLEQVNCLAAQKRREKKIRLVDAKEFQRAESASSAYRPSIHDHRMTHTGHYDSRSSHEC